MYATGIIKLALQAELKTNRQGAYRTEKELLGDTATSSISILKG